MRLVNTHNLDQIVKGCRKGKNRAQKELYELTSPTMFAICLRYTKNKMDAQDVLQDGFVRAFENINKLENADKLFGWLKRIMINTALRFLEKNQDLQFTEINYETEVKHSHQFTPCEYNELICMINELPAGYRTVFNLNVIDGYNHIEIGQQLGISETTSRSQLNRARKLLRDKLDKASKIFRNESAG